MANRPVLQLKGFYFKDLFRAEGLEALDIAFLAVLPPDLREKLESYRTQPDRFSAPFISTFLIETACHLEVFLTNLFGIAEAVALASAQTLSHQPVAAFKQLFVQRRAKKLLTQADTLPSFAELDTWLSHTLQQAPLQTEDRELAIALLASQYIQQPDDHQAAAEKLTHWCVRALSSPEGQTAVAGWTSFRLPERVDHNRLVHYQQDPADPFSRLSATAIRQRDGFTLTDPRMDARHVQDEVNYCIYCHENEGDFCSRGFPVKKGEPDRGYRQNPEDVTLTGCPLDEKISEMHWLKKEGKTLAALAMVMADNPMCPATGHRICNDCMKACIYQKQDPVDIPQIETRVLTDVLSLPWGVEIYDLLTRWNPLRAKQWRMKAWNGKKILIAGMGPAGFTLAHHLLQEGFAVVGFDGLRMEALPEHWLQTPIHQFTELTDTLDRRQVSGLGGVAEYGITVRWDKNFLRLIYLSLARRPYFQVFGSTRFGGTVTVESAFRLGFDHLALAVGAGLPKALSIPGSLAPGMRQANDFLMALQLGSADRPESLTALQVRLPAIVIGGGLTSVDTATEVQAYYIRQVENTLARYEQLTPARQKTLRTHLGTAAEAILDELLAHGAQVRKARQHQAVPDFVRLIRQWGGVTIVYRRRMKESPAWIHNHDELQKALEEGVFYLEDLEPAEVERDEHGHAKALICRRRYLPAETLRLPASSIFVATGTRPNIAYEFEHRGTFQRSGTQYQHYELREGQLELAQGITHCKQPDFGPFTSFQRGHHHVSLVGDSHPVFHGSVVRAIASAMRTWPKIASLFSATENASPDPAAWETFAHSLKEQFTAVVQAIFFPAAGITELVIRAPLAAHTTQPGHFFRLQNQAPLQGKFHMEPLALTASGVDRTAGTLTFLVADRGTSSALARLLAPGMPVSLMGPTGVRARVSATHETVLIAGDSMALPLLLMLGPALRAAGNRVICLGALDTHEALFFQPKMEAATDVMLWLTDTNEQNKKIIPGRPGDVHLTGNMLEALVHCTKQHPDIRLQDTDRIYVIGKTPLLKQFQQEQKGLLATLFPKQPVIRGSVYSTMQCMLKGVCAQCLQWQTDPETGQRTKAVFACSWPEQPLELIDLDNIDERLSQNRVPEQLNRAWLDTVTDFG